MSPPYGRLGPQSTSLQPTIYRMDSVVNSNLLQLEMQVGDQQLHVLLDTGATMNVISQIALQQLKADERVSKDLVDSVAEPQASEMLQLADGSTIPHTPQSQASQISSLRDELSDC